MRSENIFTTRRMEMLSIFLGICTEGASELEVVDIFGITLVDFDDVDREDIKTIFDYILNSREFNQALENYLDKREENQSEHKKYKRY